MHAWSAPSVAAGTIYCGCSDECLYAIDAATGNQLGRLRTTTAIWSAPVIVEGLVLAGGSAGSMYAVR